MRFDSCRKCGAELEVEKKCKICREVNLFSCPICNYVADEQIHVACSLTILDQNLPKAIVA